MGPEIDWACKHREEHEDGTPGDCGLIPAEDGKRLIGGRECLNAPAYCHRFQQHRADKWRALAVESRRMCWLAILVRRRLALLRGEIGFRGGNVPEYIVKALEWAEKELDYVSVAKLDEALKEEK